MASIVTRTRSNGITAFSVRWRDYQSGQQHRLTMRTEAEAHGLAQHINNHGELPARSPVPVQPRQRGVPSVADVVQEHIDLLVRPSSGTVGTYQRILDLHIRKSIGHIPVDEFGYRDVMLWIKGLADPGVAPKSIHNMHGLLSAAMRTAELLGYVARNPCRGIPLPTVERAEDEARFLTLPSSACSLKAFTSRTKPLCNSWS